MKWSAAVLVGVILFLALAMTAHPARAQGSPSSDDRLILGANGSTLTGGSGGGGVSKANLQDVHFTKNICKASPNLFHGLATGRHIEKATITVRNRTRHSKRGVPRRTSIF